MGEEEKEEEEGMKEKENEGRRGRQHLGDDTISELILQSPHTRSNVHMCVCIFHMYVHMYVKYIHTHRYINTHTKSNKIRAEPLT